jgi:membrane associated rhomboid family serine protease
MAATAEEDRVSRQPIFNVPTGVVWAIGIVLAVHVALSLVPERQQELERQCLGFIPARYSGPPFELPNGIVTYLPCHGTGPAVWSFITHQLVHGDWTHLALNSAWLLAFGGAVAQRVGSARFALLGFASGIAGALAFLAWRYGEPVPMVGASGAVSGLMGGAFRFFFNELDIRAAGWRADPRLVPRMSLRQSLSDRRVMVATGVVIAINVAMAAASHLFTSAGGIAWEAHLGGFAFGLLAFRVFDPARPVPRPWPSDPESPTLH